MAISDKLNELKLDISNAYNIISERGGTVPENRNTNNLPEAINSIPSGSDIKEEPPEKDFIFIDFDGIRLYSYTKEELMELSELPPLPSRDGFVYQDWNWSLDNLKLEDKMIVGALCRTSDNCHRIYISVSDDRYKKFYIKFGQTVANSFNIDWGDGSGVVSSGSSTTPSLNHTYSATGNYVITIIPIISTSKLSFYGASQYCYIATNSTSPTSWYTTMYTTNCVERIELGSNINLEGNSFCHLHNLKEINMPADLTTNASTGYLFYYCYSLKALVIPKNVIINASSTFNYAVSLRYLSISDANTGTISISVYGCSLITRLYYSGNSTVMVNSTNFYNCYGIRELKLPNTITMIGTNTFYNCYNLNMELPTSLKSIGGSAFYNCYAMEKFVFHTEITSISANTFYNCYGAKLYDFRNNTVVPSLANTNGFYGIQYTVDCKIVVPDNLYDEWITATNWSTTNIKSKIVKASDYND